MTRITDEDFWEFVDYEYERGIDERLTALENDVRQVTNIDGYIIGADAEYAGWYTGIAPGAEGRTELTDELRKMLEAENIKIVEGENDE